MRRARHKLQLRELFSCTISLSYNLPKTLLAKTKVIKRASITATANNLLLFTNYNGDPEVAAAGSGAVGSSSVGIGVFGLVLTSSQSSHAESETQAATPRIIFLYSFILFNFHTVKQYLESQINTKSKTCCRWNSTIINTY